MVRTAEREDKFIWVKKLGEDNFAFFAAHPVDKYKITGIGDARSWRTVALKQDLTYQLLLKNGFNDNHHLFIVTNLDAAFQTFFSGRVELIVTTKEIMNAMALKYGQNASRWGVLMTNP